MSLFSLARIKIGSLVRIVHQPDRDRGYVKSARDERRLGNGLMGITIAEHDSHGLCYQVRLPSLAVITYDREELEVMPSSTAEKRKA